LPKRSADRRQARPRHPERSAGFDEAGRAAAVLREDLPDRRPQPLLAEEEPIELVGLLSIPMLLPSFRVYNDWLIDYCSHCPKTSYFHP
jgi:hypothetical protein